jgi:hypothetical protein
MGAALDTYTQKAIDDLKQVRTGICSQPSDADIIEFAKRLRAYKPGELKALCDQGKSPFYFEQDRLVERKIKLPTPDSPDEFELTLYVAEPPPYRLNMFYDPERGWTIKGA